VDNAGGSGKLASRRLVEHLARAHQAAGERPASAPRAATQLNEVGLEPAALDREQHRVDGDLGPCRAMVAHGCRCFTPRDNASGRGLGRSHLLSPRFWGRGGGPGSIEQTLMFFSALARLIAPVKTEPFLPPYAPSSSIRSSARLAPSRTSSASAIS